MTENNGRVYVKMVCLVYYALSVARQSVAKGQSVIEGRSDPYLAIGRKIKILFLYISLITNSENKRRGIKFDMENFGQHM